MKKTIVLLLLCIPTISYSANDFSADPTLEGHYKFDDGALTTDSSGNTHTLSLTGSGITADTGDKQEGDASATQEHAGLYTVADYMDWTAPWTICVWFKVDAKFDGQTLISAYQWTGTTIYTFAITIQTDGDINWTNGNGSTQTEDGLLGVTIANATWYHGGFTYDGENIYSARIYNGATSTTYTPTREIAIGDGDTAIRIMGVNTNSNELNGNMDELAIFSRALSVADIDLIRAGTYTYATADPEATAYYIDTDVVGGTKDGLSWANAYEDMNDFYTWALDSNDPITRNESWTVYLRGDTVDSNVPITGTIPTDATHPIVFSGDLTSTTWNTSQYMIAGPNEMLWTIDSNYVTVQNIQMQLTAEDGAGDGCLTITTPHATANLVQVITSIFRGDNINDQDDIAVTSTDTGTNLYWYRNAIYDVNEGTDLLVNCKMSFTDSQPSGGGGSVFSGVVQ